MAIAMWHNKCVGGRRGHGEGNGTMQMRRACGHTEQVYGGNYDYKREGARVCKQCWIAQQANTVTADAVEMPVLKGSDKQVSWARKIRAEYVSKWDEVVTQRAGASDASQVVRFRRAIAMLLEARTDASWWIDNRTVPAGQMLAPVFAAA